MAWLPRRVLFPRLGDQKGANDIRGGLCFSLKHGLSQPVQLAFWHSGALAWKLAILWTDNADGSACHPSSALTHHRMCAACRRPAQEMVAAQSNLALVESSSAHRSATANLIDAFTITPRSQGPHDDIARVSQVLRTLIAGSSLPSVSKVSTSDLARSKGGAGELAIGSEAYKCKPDVSCARSAHSVCFACTQKGTEEYSPSSPRAHQAKRHQAGAARGRSSPPPAPPACVALHRHGG